MDEPTAPADEQDQPTPTDDATPEVQAPEAEQAEAEVEGIDLDNFDLAQVPEDADREWFEARYGDLRSDYTRKTQELADQRKQVSAIVDAIKDPEHPSHAEVMDYLGLEFADDEDAEESEYDFDEGDPLAEIRQEIAALKQEREQEQQFLSQQQQEAALEDYLESSITDLQRREGIDEFNDDELALLVNAAVAMPNEQGQPDIDAAYARFKGAFAARQKAWMGSKRAPRAPGDGVPGSAELDVTDRSQRLSESERIAQAAMGG
jgi:hypothetical protein